MLFVVLFWIGWGGLSELLFSSCSILFFPSSVSLSYFILAVPTRVFGKTLLHEFLIFFNHTECYLLFREIRWSKWSKDFLTDCREWLTWLDELKWLLAFRLTGLFRALCASFHIHSFLLDFFPYIFNCLILILLFPCAGVRENTRAWVPLFL